MSNKDCSVCLDVVDETKGNADTVKPCGHTFHSTCLSQWLVSKNDTCPMCRGKVQSIVRLEKKVVKATDIPKIVKEIEKEKKILKDLRTRLLKEDSDKQVLIQRHNKACAEHAVRYSKIRADFREHQAKLRELESRQ